MKEQIEETLKALDKYIIGSRKYNTQFAAGGYAVAMLIRGKLKHIIEQ